MFGTYELLDLFKVNGQVSRRSQYFHFPRYNVPSIEEMTENDGRKSIKTSENLPDNDYENFKAAIIAFQKLFHFEEEPQLIKHHILLYTLSAGLIGILKDWLERAYGLAIASGAETITLENLNDSVLRDGQVARIAQEIKEGEEEMKEMDNQLQLIMRLLGINTIGDEVRLPVETGEQTKSNNKPGNRNPTRDPVGDS